MNTDSCTVVVINSEKSILVRRNEHGLFYLPRIPFSRGERVAEQVTGYIRRQWKLETLCLFSSDAEGASDRWQVLAATEPCKPVTTDLNWMPAAGLPDQQHRVCVEEILQQLREYESGARRGPFGRPGWLNDFRAWTDPILARHGVHWTGRVHQLSGSPESALLRLETEGPPVWFKAVSGSLKREYALTLCIAERCPECLPVLLGAHEGWTAWLMMEAPGQPLDESHKLSAWERAADTLAQIQLSHIDRTMNLLSAGALDWTLPVLLSRAMLFCERLPHLMALQPETARATPLTTTECASLRVQLPGVIGELFGGPLPMTIVHGDLNPGNIFVAPNQCSILDWAETYVSHPFIGFELLAAHLRQVERETAHEWEPMIRRRYFARWNSRIDESPALELAGIVAPLLKACNALDRLDDAVANEIRERDTMLRSEAVVRSLARIVYRRLQSVSTEVLA
jgi:hypothetical protein